MAEPKSIILGLYGFSGWSAFNSSQLVYNPTTRKVYAFLIHYNLSGLRIWRSTDRINWSELVVIEPAVLTPLSGTTTVNNSTTVVGTGTSFLTDFRTAARDSIRLSTSPPGPLVNVITVTSDVDLTTFSAIGDGTTQAIFRNHRFDNKSEIVHQARGNLVFIVVVHTNYAYNSQNTIQPTTQHDTPFILYVFDMTTETVIASRVFPREIKGQGGFPQTAPAIIPDIIGTVGLVDHSNVLYMLYNGVVTGNFWSPVWASSSNDGVTWSSDANLFSSPPARHVFLRGYLKGASGRVHLFFGSHARLDTSGAPWKKVSLEYATWTLPAGTISNYQTLVSHTDGSTGAGIPLLGFGNKGYGFPCLFNNNTQIAYPYIYRNQLASPQLSMRVKIGTESATPVWTEEIVTGAIPSDIGFASDSSIEFASVTCVEIRGVLHLFYRGTVGVSGSIDNNIYWMKRNGPDSWTDLGLYHSRPTVPPPNALHENANCVMPIDMGAEGVGLMAKYASLVLDGTNPLNILWFVENLLPPPGPTPNPQPPPSACVP